MNNIELYKYIASQVNYSPLDGVFTWSSPRANNRIQEGDIAGSLSGNGYIVLTFRYEGSTRSVLGHRLAFYMSHGYLPKIIDHKNGNKIDNSESNLREVTSSENRMNARLRSDNASKVTGVYFRKDCNRWRAEITKDGVKKHLGLFDTKDDAIKSRLEAEKELFGEFSSSERDESAVVYKPRDTTGRSGVRYVVWHNQAKKWQAKPNIGGLPVSLGLFDTIEEASAKVKTWTTDVDAYFSEEK